MAIIYKESTDCDGWHNGGAIAFRDNNSALRYAATALGEELMTLSSLKAVETDYWQVSAPEGYLAMRVEYEPEPSGSAGGMEVDQISEVIHEDVDCNCDRGDICKGHPVSWNGRTSVKLPVKTG